MWWVQTLWAMSSLEAIANSLGSAISGSGQDYVVSETLFIESLSHHYTVVLLEDDLTMMDPRQQDCKHYLQDSHDCPRW